MGAAAAENQHTPPSTGTCITQNVIVMTWSLDKRRKENQYAPQVSTVVLAARRGLLGSHRHLEISRLVRWVEAKITELGAHELDGLSTIVGRTGWRDCHQLVRHSARPTAVLPPDM